MATFKIIVNQPNGETIYAETNSTMKIYQLKQLLSEQTNIPSHTFMLMFAGSELDEETTVGDCQIEAYAMVHMIAMVIGGQER